MEKKHTFLRLFGQRRRMRTTITYRFFGQFLDDIHGSLFVHDMCRPSKEVAFQLHDCKFEGKFNDSLIIWQVNLASSSLVVLVTSTVMCISLQEHHLGIILCIIQLVTMYYSTTQYYHGLKIIWNSNYLLRLLKKLSIIINSYYKIWW